MTAVSGEKNSAPLKETVDIALDPAQAPEGIHIIPVIRDHPEGSVRLVAIAVTGIIKNERIPGPAPGQDFHKGVVDALASGVAVEQQGHLIGGHPQTLVGQSQAYVPAVGLGETGIDVGVRPLQTTDHENPGATGIEAVGRGRPLSPGPSGKSQPGRQQSSNHSRPR